MKLWVYVVVHLCKWKKEPVKQLSCSSNSYLYHDLPPNLHAIWSEILHKGECESEE